MLISWLIALIMAFVPQCEHEDGSTQALCVWDDRRGSIVLNIDYGGYWMTWEREN